MSNEFKTKKRKTKKRELVRFLVMKMSIKLKFINEQKKLHFYCWNFNIVGRKERTVFLLIYCFNLFVINHKTIINDNEIDSQKFIINNNLTLNFIRLLSNRNIN